MPRYCEPARRALLCIEASTALFFLLPVGHLPGAGHASIVWNIKPMVALFPARCSCTLPGQREASNVEGNDLATRLCTVRAGPASRGRHAIEQRGSRLARNADHGLWLSQCVPIPVLAAPLKVELCHHLSGRCNDLGWCAGIAIQQLVANKLSAREWARSVSRVRTQPAGRSQSLSQPAA